MQEFGGTGVSDVFTEFVARETNSKKRTGLSGIELVAQILISVVLMPDQFSNIEFLTSTPPRMVFAQFPNGRRLLVYGSGVAKAILKTGRSLGTTQESVAVSSEDEAIALKLKLRPYAINPYVK